MKKIEINYTSNEQLWTLETVAEAHGSTKRSDTHRREEAERVASSARSLIGCMRNDYIVAE